MQGCDRCDNPATVHLTEIRSGEKTERHLCEKCARDLHVPGGKKELQKLLKTLEPMPAQRRVAELTKTCPDCGLSYAEFRKTGRFGCPLDYEVFADELPQLLERIHGRSTYEGKAPHGGFVHDGRLLDEREQLRRRLEEAVEAEDYREAARLRDELEALSPEADATSEAETDDG